MDSKKVEVLKKRSIFGSRDMKKSESELALEELFASHNYNQDDKKTINHSAQHAVLVPIHDAHHLHVPFKNSVAIGLKFQEVPNAKGFSSSSLAADDHNPLMISSSNPNPPKLSTTIDSPILSICVDSMQSDEEEEEEEYMEDASNEHFNNPTNIKRIKRMVSNRESARRSRRRKQAHLSELEEQVEQLRGENSSLFQQIDDASHQFKNAATNNRLLKSDLGALRAKVKLAEDLVARGSLTSSLTHLLHNYLNTPQDYM